MNNQTSSQMNRVSRGGEMTQPYNTELNSKIRKQEEFCTIIPFDLESTKIAESKIRKVLYETMKRFSDIFLSFFALILLSPIFLLVAIVIKIKDRGPIFYKAKRIGKNGKLIKITKFRSMSVNAEKLEDMLSPEELKEYHKNFKLDDDPRITSFGKLMRKTSIDELPQLFDIFVGKLSLIGPRPVLEEETELYGNKRDLFLSVKPGLTGFWQAYGRSNVTYESGKRQAMELYYVRNRSFVLDIKIFFQTIVAVLKCDGAQ